MAKDRLYFFIFFLVCLIIVCGCYISFPTSLCFAADDERLSSARSSYRLYNHHYTFLLALWGKSLVLLVFCCFAFFCYFRRTSRQSQCILRKQKPPAVVYTTETKAGQELMGLQTSTLENSKSPSPCMDGKLNQHQLPDRVHKQTDTLDISFPVGFINRYTRYRLSYRVHKQIHSISAFLSGSETDTLDISFPIGFINRYIRYQLSYRVHKQIHSIPAFPSSS